MQTFTQSQLNLSLLLICIIALGNFSSIFVNSNWITRPAGYADERIRVNGEQTILKSHPLSSLNYSSIFGGLDDDYATDVVCDSNGNVFITGYTSSRDFPIDGYVNDSLGFGTDCFIMKFNPTGTTLLYSAVIGGSGYDAAFSIDIDSTGNAYIVGQTSSYDFPTVGAYDSSYNGGGDCFLVKINPEGDTILYSTYIGGSNSDTAEDILVESSGSVLIAGYTSSYEFPVTNEAFDQSYNAAVDGFVLKIDTEANNLVFSSFFGGFEGDYIYSIAVDSGGDVYVAGETKSHDMPTSTSAFDRTHNGGSWDAFVFKLSSDGTSLIFSSYYGGTKSDYVNEVLIDSQENVILVGSTASQDFPTTRAYDETFNGDFDCYVLKLDSDGDEMIFSTLMGGSDYDSGYAAAIDSEGNVLVTGRTYSSNLPVTSAAISTSRGLQADAFVIKLSSDGMDLRYCTYLGGSRYESGYGIAINSDGNAILAGYTDSSDFPIKDGYMDSSTGEANCFLISLPDLTDSDGDMLTDIEENSIGSNPNQADTDGDSLSDFWEYHNGFDPTDSFVPLSERMIYYLPILVPIPFILAIFIIIVLRHRVWRTIQPYWQRQRPYLLYECPSCKTRFEAPAYGTGSRKLICPECGVRAKRDNLVKNNENMVQ